MTFTIPAASNASGSIYPVGLYVFELRTIGLDDKPSQFGDGPRVALEFDVLSIIDSQDRKAAKAAMQRGDSYRAWCNLTMGRKATFRAWAEALLNRTLADGEKIDPSDLIGKRAKASVIAYTKQDGTEGVKIGALQPFVADDDEDDEPPPRPAGSKTKVDDKDLF